VAFLGDGASNSGAFHESLNLASVLKLPVVFVLENNGFADATRISYAAAIENLSERARAYGLPGFTVDGCDVFAVFDAAGEATERARKDGIATLLECKTYRYYGHFVGDVGSYRTKGEVEEQKKGDCILRFEEKVIENGWLDRSELNEIKKNSVRLVDEAVAFAESSPEPGPEECVNDVYLAYR
jgi:acetoin:2,6-dichlorophenolindophenol oxidoreductase subunit alpha